MNHLTEAEAFRRRLNRLSLPQLREAMLVLRKHDEAAVDRALDFAATPFGVPDDSRQAALRSALAYLAVPDVELAEQAEIAHISVGDIEARDPLTVGCPDCGAPEGERCFTDFGCMARFSAAQVAS